METITNCKRIETAIRRATKMLKERAAKDGLYENFGEKEVMLIEDKFIDSSLYTDEMNRRRNLLIEFSKWCISYDGK